jgi:His-Xaa-Ser system protein HxsD
MPNIVIDLQLTSLKAVRRAVYEFDKFESVVIESKRNGMIQLSIMTEQNHQDYQTLINQFKQLIQDHQLGIELEEEFHNIREILLAQAFFPCSNLEEIITD